MSVESAICEALRAERWIRSALLPGAAICEALRAERWIRSALLPGAKRPATTLS